MYLFTELTVENDTETLYDFKSLIKKDLGFEKGI
jgi:hypothetical protein